MRTRPLLVVPVMFTLLAVAGCVQEPAASSSSPMVRAPQQPTREVSQSGDEGLTCVDEVDDVRGGPGYDLDRATIGIDDTFITTTFTAGQQYHWDNANLQLAVVLTDTATGRALTLDAFVTDDGTTTLRQQSGGSWHGVLNNYAQSSIRGDGQTTTIKWSIGDIEYTIPADFTWSAYVTYSNKHDECPGGEDYDADNTLRGSWQVPAAF